MNKNNTRKILALLIVSFSATALFSSGSFADSRINDTSADTPYLKDVLNQWVQKESGNPVAAIDPDTTIGSVLENGAGSWARNPHLYSAAAKDLSVIFRGTYNRDFDASHFSFDLKVSTLALEAGAVVNP